LLTSIAGAEEPDSPPLNSPASPVAEDPAYRPANELVSQARELLEILQVDAPLLRQAKQGSELGPADHAVLLECLYRFPLLEMHQLEPLVQPLPAWEKLAGAAASYVGGVYRLRGTVIGFNDLTPPDTATNTPQAGVSPDDGLIYLASRKPILQLYRTRLLVQGKIVEVYSNRVPEIWKKKSTDQKPAAWEGGQQVEVWAYLLKQGSSESGPAYIFAAPRVRWFPETTLGKLGFDYELFDDVQQRQTLLKAENEIFYELLALAKRTPAEIYQSAKSRENQIVELWDKPELHVGELLAFRGQVRHAARIAVEDSALAARLGFDHYYCLELFVPLTKPTVLQIPIQHQADENKGTSNKAPQEFDKIHFDSLPLVFYCHELPPGETVQSLKDKQLDVRGFFLKSWRYQSNVPLSNQQHASLLGPLLMGGRPELVVSAPIAGADVPGLLILAVVGGSVLVGMIYLWLNQSDRNRRPATLPEKIEFDRAEVKP
jgi:hypothetical protein